MHLILTNTAGISMMPYYKLHHANWNMLDFPSQYVTLHFLISGTAFYAQDFDGIPLALTHARTTITCNCNATDIIGRLGFSSICFSLTGPSHTTVHHFYLTQQQRSPQLCQTPRWRHRGASQKGVLEPPSSADCTCAGTNMD